MSHPTLAPSLPPLSWHVTGLVARECANVMVVVCTRPLNASHMGALDAAVPAPYTEVHTGRAEYLVVH